jgi:hypothetical protein
MTTVILAAAAITVAKYGAPIAAAALAYRHLKSTPFDVDVVVTTPPVGGGRADEPVKKNAAGRLIRRDLFLVYPGDTFDDILRAVEALTGTHRASMTVAVGTIDSAAAPIPVPEAHVTLTAGGLKASPAGAPPPQLFVQVGHVQAVSPTSPGGHLMPVMVFISKVEHHALPPPANGAPVTPVPQSELSPSTSGLAASRSGSVFAASAPEASLYTAKTCKFYLPRSTPPAEFIKLVCMATHTPLKTAWFDTPLLRRPGSAFTDAKLAQDTTTVSPATAKSLPFDERLRHVARISDVLADVEAAGFRVLVADEAPPAAVLRTSQPAVSSRAPDEVPVSTFVDATATAAAPQGG